jgi:quercetin dioxygenase-like cupin family protein
MSDRQTFSDSTRQPWSKIDFLPGVELLSLAEPVPGGSIHLARLAAGTLIPPHTHPGDEYVYVLSGTIETGSTRCPAGSFWRVPRGTRQGPHIAVTDVQILTIRLGAMGSFEGI